ncbi:MAG: hypothetical protein M0R17_04160 [Candidatus Omnitrophica bacterium]|jgi:hypothetical protein|nr:hypothetical protein [Candidatus Omnitrophota bacterium]
MNVLQTDVELFDNLMEGIDTKLTKPQSKAMLESRVVNKFKKDASIADKRKDKIKSKDDKKKSAKAKKIFEAIDALHYIKSSITAANEYVADTPAKSAFLEACNDVDGALFELASEIDDKYKQYYELYKKAYEGGQLTPDEKQFLDNNAPVDDTTPGTSYNNDSDFDSFNTPAQIPSAAGNSEFEKKNLTNPSAI